MLNTLKQYFGYDSFRPLQEEIIRHILDKKDCLVLMPTGGGKSICFQVPALMMEGTTIVVSPLISLMKDQVEALRANGIPAAALNSNATEMENREIAERAFRGEYKLLYVSPEKLLFEVEQGILRFAKGDEPQGALRVSLIAVDEAHCISSWGHDFRPEYTQLGQLRDLFPNVPIAAFTATADKITKDDIVEQMRLKPCPSADGEGEEEVRVFISSFDRPNLSLDVRRGYSAKDKLKYLLGVIGRHQGESGIVYCLSRKTTEKVAEDLRERGVKAQAYHAGLTAEVRDRVQEDFINDRVDVVCATIAFGMGIDKSNVRFVAHYNLPKSIENYYQEIGRGGRDGLPCETVLFYNVGDLITLRNFADGSGQVQINNDKLERMQEYAESPVCRRRILLNYFGETMDHDCCNCDVCGNPPKRFDGTRLVQMALSAVMRTKQNEGFHMIIDIVRGSSNQELQQKGYHQLKTWGVGRDVPQKDWQDYMLQMLHLGYVEIDYKDNSHLKVTQQGEDVLYGRKSAQMAVVMKEDFTVKTRRKLMMEEAMSGMLNRGPEDVVLFEKLRQHRMQVATEMGVPPYVVFGDRTLHELATLKPETVVALGTISGIGTHKKEQFGLSFVKVIRQHLGLSVNENEEWALMYAVASRTPTVTVAREPKVKTVRDYITIKGVEYHIDLSILECIKWRAAIDHLNRDLYYNLWQDTVQPMTEYVSANTPQREQVVKRFAEIITEACGVKVSPDYEQIWLPKREELDANGKPVHTLACRSFEDGFAQLCTFIEQTAHYPFAGGDEHECSLRRWYQEALRGIVATTEEQRAQLASLAERYPDAAKIRSQMKEG